MGFSDETYAAAKKYTDNTVAGAGGLAGVPCQIQSITPITGGNRVTFLWIDNNGDEHTSTMNVMNGVDGENGEDGKGIQSVSVNAENHLIITYTDGTSADAGQIEIHSAVDSVNGQTGAVVLDAEDVGALPDDTPIPSKTSDLTNDSGFITKVVNDLVSYYLKSETYSKTEVDDIVTAIKNSRFEVVATLPTTDIKTNVIYLVPKSPSQTSNVKDEYINLDGTTAGWEKIGDTEIDLSNYVTTQALNTALAAYTTTADLTTLLAAKQDTLTFDNVPTENSNNPVKSGGVFAGLDGKADKVSGATNGNFAGLNASGNLTDSGKKASDFALAGGLTDEIKKRFVNNCKNVLPIRLKSQTARGVTFTRNENDSFSLSGTCTGNPLTIDLFSASVYTNTGDSSAFKIEKGIVIDKTKPYILTRGDTQIRFTLALYQDGVSVATVGFDSTGGNPFMEIDFSSYTFNEIKAVVRFGYNTSYNNKTFIPMLCLKSDYQVDSGQQYYTKTNKQLTEDSVTWDNLSEVGAVNYLNSAITTQTKNGATYTNLGDGKYKVGASEAPSYTSNCISTIAITLKKSTYKWTASEDGESPIGSDACYAFIRGLNGTVDWYRSYQSSHGYGVFTLTQDSTIEFGLAVNSSTAFSEITFYPMITPVSYNGPYVPYAKTNRQLTEDSVDWKSNSVLGAKNFLHTNGSQTTRGVLFERDENGVFTVTRQTADSNHAYYNNGRFTLKPGTYIFSNGYDSLPSGIQATYLYNYTDSSYFTNCNNGPKTFTITEEKELAFNIEVQSSQSPNGVKIYPMIRLASDNDATYQPYAMTNQELTKVNVAEVNISIQTSELAQYRVRKCGKIVECTISLQVNEAVTAWTDFATVPEGFRPSTYIQVVNNKTIYTGFAIIQINPNGGIQSAVNLAVGDRVRFTAVWICP